MTRESTLWKISALGQLSILLEASSPKPGNVNRVNSFSDTSYRHFLASASLFNRGLYKSADRGWKLGQGELHPRQIELGNLIHQSSRQVFGELELSNTIQGTILLYIPLITAISASVSEAGKFDIDRTQYWAREIIQSTTVDDTIELYHSLRGIPSSGDKHKASSRWQDFHSRFDIDNPSVFKNIRKDQVTLHELFAKSARVDPICEEWTNDFSFILHSILPKLVEYSESFEDIEEAIVRTFIWLLAEKPDGLIAKKTGWETATKVQKLARAAYQEGHDDIPTAMQRLDKILREHGNLKNPGSTADFVSAGVLCKLVSDVF